jgi:hypothetical protein
MGFTKAKGEQAKLKIGFYGKQGSGKTFTALLLAEGLAARENKRIAYVDTERGTDFYAQQIPERKFHPQAWDFDRIVTRSIMEALEAIAEIDTKVYGVVVVDSITHLWEAVKEAYTGKRMANGQIPIQAWGPLKKPYKKLMAVLLDGDYHAIICGREGVVMEENDEGETKVVGQKMKAEGETAYEPHVLVRMISAWQPDKSCRVEAFVEKDRSGILSNRTIPEPNYATFEPLVRYLNKGVQVKIGSLEDSTEQDIKLIEAEQERIMLERQTIYEQIRTAIVGAKDLAQLKAAWGLTQGKKTRLGDLMDQLEAAKDGRKTELVQGAA